LKILKKRLTLLRQNEHSQGSSESFNSSILSTGISMHAGWYHCLQGPMFKVIQ